MKPFTKLVATILGIISILHLLRLIFGWRVMINNYDMPLWVSIAGFVIAAIFSVGLWKESKK